MHRKGSVVFCWGVEGVGVQKVRSELTAPPLLWSVIAVQYTAGTIDLLLGLQSRLDVFLANTMFMRQLNIRIRKVV